MFACFFLLFLGMPGTLVQEEPARRHALFDWLEQGEYARAEAYLERLLQRRSAPVYEYLMGLCLARQLRYAEAEPHLRAAVAAAPDRSGWWNLWAETLAAMGRYREAMGKLERALALAPEPKYHYNRAMAALNAGLTIAAEADLAATLKLQPDHRAALLKLAELELDGNRSAEARVLLDRCLRERPEDGEAVFLMGTALYRDGELQQAVNHLKKAIQMFPEHPGAHFNLARVLKELGREEEARRHFQSFSQAGQLEERVQSGLQYLQSAPRDAAAQAETGRLLLRIGRPADARRHLESALQLGWNDRSLAADLARARAQAGVTAAAARAERAVEP